LIQQYREIGILQQQSINQVARKPATQAEQPCITEYKDLIWFFPKCLFFLKCLFEFSNDVMAATSSLLLGGSALHSFVLGQNSVGADWKRGKSVPTTQYIQLK
jgi:hypothetical protein